MLGRRQIGRQLERSQIRQGPGDFRESLLDLVQPRRQHGGRIGGKNTLRMSHQASPIRRVPDPIPLEQDQLLLETKFVPGKAGQKLILFRGGKGRQVVGQGGSDLSGGKFRLCRLREISRQSGTLNDP